MERQPPPPEEAASKGQGWSWQRLLTAFYALLLLAGSTVTPGGLPRLFDWGELLSADKIAHFGAYAVFAVLLAFSFADQRRNDAVARGILFASLFGALMEVLQGLMNTGREADLLDMIANLVGALLGGLFSFLFWDKIKKYLTTVGSL